MSNQNKNSTTKNFKLFLIGGKIMKFNLIKTAILTSSVVTLGLTNAVFAEECSDNCTITTDAVPELHLIDTTAGADDWEFENAGNGQRLAIDLEGSGGNGMFVVENGAIDNQLVLDDNNNVGIHTASPQSSNELEVAGNTGSGDTFAAIAISPGGPSDDSGRMTVSDTSDTYSIGVRTGPGGYNNPFVIDLDAGNNMLVIDQQGDVGMGGVTVSNVKDDLHVVGGQVFLDPNGTTGDWQLNPSSSGLWFRSEDGSDTQPVKFGANSPTNSLVVESNTGDIGVGLSSPTVPLHVRRTNGTAKVFVEETNATAAARTLFELKNKGNVKFSITNTSPAVEWSFANPGDSLRFSRQGSGEVEFQLDNNGDLEIAGALTENSDVNSKQDIENIEHSAILEKVSELEIKKWSYKDAPDVRHIGPMAQDFHKAFGLGHTDTGIATLDTTGVALSSIKALHVELMATQATIAEKDQRIAELESRVDSIQTQLSEVSELKEMLVRYIKQDSATDFSHVSF